MRIAILHFHLRPGGVTRVIEMAHSALTRAGHDVLVISGEPAPTDCRLPREAVAVAPDLAYDIGPERESNLRGDIGEIVQGRWGCWPDALHIHNHSLGKNFALPLSVARWAGEGRSMVLQIHDFAENGRPANYRKLVSLCGELREVLYPDSANIRYALLNTHDRSLLAGIFPSERTVFLPNPVALPEGEGRFDKSRLGAERLVVYPARAIRRKNIGEVVFWAALSGGETHFLITSPPQSPADSEICSGWERLALEHGLPVVFDAIGKYRVPLGDFLRGADFCVTTSVGEGFGMAFLEPWLAGASLAGRDLPGVTRDFAASGVRLDNLYARLDIPEGVFFDGEVDGMVRHRVEASCLSYGMAADSATLERAVHSVCSDGRVDFGRLDEELQRKAVEAVLDGRLSRQEVAPGLLAGNPDNIAGNREAVAKNFSLERYAERLTAIYEDAADSTAGSPDLLDAGAVLRRFLGAGDFYALRS